MTRFRLLHLSWTVPVLLLAAACSDDSDVVETAGPAMEARATEAAANPLGKLGAAPSWSLPRLDGSTLNSDELKGKVVVVDFWATWCPPCREEIPGYVELQKKYEAQGLVIVGVSLDQGGTKAVKDFATRYGINYPVVMGDQETVAAFGDVQAIPTTFLIDRDGQIRHRKVGAMPQSEYEPIIKSLL